MKMTGLATWFLVIGGYAAATGQTVVQGGSVSEPSAGMFLSVQQSEKDEPLQRLHQGKELLLTAKTVFVIVEEPAVAFPTAKVEQALKKELIKWGRFQVVDEAAMADLIITISDYSSSKRMMMEHVRESMAVFAGGSSPAENAMPLWSIDETGPAFGSKRPTRKLVEDFRKDLTEVAKSLPAPTAPLPVSQPSQNGIH